MSWVSPISNLIGEHVWARNVFAAKLTVRTGLRYGLGKHVDAVAPEKVVEYLKVNCRLSNNYS